jgi:predicted ATPase
LKEQISLINDHIWLLDLKKTFKNQKYLIIVKKTTSEEASEEQVGDIIQTLENSLSHKYDRLHNIMMRRMETLDNLTRALFKNQTDQSVKMQKLVSVVRTSEHTLNDVSRQVKGISGEK